MLPPVSDIIIIESFAMKLGTWAINCSDYCLQEPYIKQIDTTTSNAKKKVKIENQFDRIDCKLIDFIIEAYQSTKGSLVPIILSPSDSKHKLVHFAAFCELSKFNFGQSLFDSESITSVHAIELYSLYNKLYTNSSDQVTTLIIEGKLFVIPPYCEFILTDFTLLPDFLSQTTQKYDLITMDPPWFNKSASRGPQYQQLDCFDLLKIPIPLILSKNGLVCVWVSNNAKYHDFVVKKLFKKWGLVTVSTWIWIKVTCLGQPVIPFDSRHRKPYEVMYIGQRASNKSKSKDELVTSSNTGLTGLKRLPKQKIIISIPSKQHSRKPDMTQCFDEYLPANSKKLELFARFVSSGFTCWGNETLMFNQECFFTKSHIS